MVSPYGPFSQNVRMALNCDAYMRMDLYARLTAEYVAAQLNVQFAVPFWYPQLSRQKLFCHVNRMPMPGPRAIPVRLSNGRVLDDNSSLQDLFDATDAVAFNGSDADRRLLLNIYLQLNNCRKD